MWIVINTTTGALLSGPLDDEPTVKKGQTALGDMPPGYGETWQWVPGDENERGRADIVPLQPVITDPLLIAAIGRVQTAGLITADQAAAMLAGLPPD